MRVRHVCRWVNSYIEFESAEQLQPGKWYHVTFRCDGRMQGLAYRASLNGSDAAMKRTHEVSGNSAVNAGKAPLVLGGSPLKQNFRGQLRDLRFYDRELGQDEVNSLAEARSLADLARIPESNRTAKEKRILRLAYLESDALPAAIKKLRRELFQSQAALKNAIRATPTTMVMKDVDLGPTHVHAAGAYDQPTDPVPANTPAVLPPMPDTGRRDRLALARWLTQPDHPLTARVAVNRIWQILWGRGFVDSPENFGTQTPEPLHSDLLDWLAAEYLRLGWDTKALIKLTVTSRTYRQDSSAPERLWITDPRNQQLARGPRFRLPVQVVRDQALHLSGRLDPQVGGPPVALDVVPGKDGKPVKLDYEVSNRRRTLYTFWKRNAPHPMLAVFDVADRNQCDVRTRRTNTPLQALVTLNEPGLAECAKDLGVRARASAETEAEQLHWIWQACTGREPVAQEASMLRQTLDRYRELAPDNREQAWTSLANLLLNLDATLTLE